MATLQELEQALVNAHKAGDQMAAAKLANIIKKERDRRRENPDIKADEIVPGTVPKPERTLGEKIVGGAEALGSTVSGLTAGQLGEFGGALKQIGEEIALSKTDPTTVMRRLAQIGLAPVTAGTSLMAGMTGEEQKRIAEEAEAGGERFTYQPQTEAGQEYRPYTDVAGTVLALGAGGVAGAKKALPYVKKVMKLKPPKARLPGAPEPVLGPSPGTVSPEVAPVQMELPGIAPKVAVGPKVQAAEMAAKPTMAPPGVKPRMKAKMSPEEQEMLLKASEREARAASLEKPIQLTKGQKTQEFKQQQFEREIAKTEAGEPIQQHYTKQNAALDLNMEQMIKSTDAELAGDLRALGEAITGPLYRRQASDNANIRRLYNEAAKSPEGNIKTTLTNFEKYLNETFGEAESAPILKTARSVADRIVGTKEVIGGGTRFNNITLKEAEQLRKAIINATNKDAPNIYHATQLKKALDMDTKSVGGKLYNEARAARRQYAKDYEEVGLVKSILENKQGTSDRITALENVFEKTVLSKGTSKDSLLKVKKLLETAPGGQTAWYNEMRGALYKHLKDQAFSGTARDQAGNIIISPAKLSKAIKDLDRSGKLEVLLGEKGVKKLKLFNEVVKDVMISPQGSVNTSNTMTAGLMAIAQGLLLPFRLGGGAIDTLTQGAIKTTINGIKNQALKIKIQKALKG